MQTVYKTLDGQIFEDTLEAQKHEEHLLQCVKMWNWVNERTTNTVQARLLHLTGEDAGKMFKAMVAANREEHEFADDQFDDEDNGWFYFDEYASKYRYLDREVVDAIIHATHEI